jgi:type VI secretion system secreted protein Hcp
MNPLIRLKTPTPAEERNPRHPEVHRLQRVMKTLTKVFLILLVCYFVAAANGASLEIFLKIEGIQGDVTFRPHENEINALSFHMGVQNSSDPFGGGQGGSPNFAPLTVFKFIDVASPQLCLAAARGDQIRSATLVVSDAETHRSLYRIVLEPVLISSVNNNASETDPNGNLIESIDLIYGRITWTISVERGGPITHFFDRRTGNSG